MTPPNARPLAVSPDTWEDAKSEVASSPSQSPNDAMPSTIHRRRNGRIRSTAFSAPIPDRSTFAWPPPAPVGRRDAAPVPLLSMAAPPAPAHPWAPPDPPHSSPGGDLPDPPPGPLRDRHT